MKDAIRKYLLAHSATLDVGPLSDDDSLLESGVLDSVAMVDLIAFIEKSYGIHVDEDDMVPEHFDSVCAIAAYVQGKHVTSS